MNGRKSTSRPVAASSDVTPDDEPTPDRPARPAAWGGADGSADDRVPGADARSIRVVVVGAPGLEVDALLAMLDREGSVEVVAVVDRDPREVAEAEPDVAVVDLSGDGGPGSVEAPCCECRVEVPPACRPRPSPHAPRTGAPCRVVTFRGRRHRPRTPEGVDAASGWRECSPREREVLAVLAEGATNPEIAARLSISEATVRSHVQNLRGKLRARSRVELVVRAFAMGLGPFECAQ